MQAKAAEDVARADSLLGEMRGLRQRTVTILSAAEQAGDHRTALVAIAQARANVEMMARLLVAAEAQAQAQAEGPDPVHADTELRGVAQDLSAGLTRDELVAGWAGVEAVRTGILPGWAPPALVEATQAIPPTP